MSTGWKIFTVSAVAVAGLALFLGVRYMRAGGASNAGSGSGNSGVSSLNNMLPRDRVATVNTTIPQKNR